MAGAGIAAPQHGEVTEVQGDRMDPDQDFTPLGAGISLLAQAELIKAGEAVEPVGLHGGMSLSAPRSWA